MRMYSVFCRREYFELPYPNVRLPVDPLVADKSTWLLKVPKP